MKRQLLLVVALCTSSLFAQDVVVNQNINGGTPAVPSGKDIAVKSSPAEDALVQMSAQLESIQKTFNDLFQQARTNLDTKNKPILEEMKARSKKWQEKIDADTKDLKAQIDKNQAEAQAQFQKETASLTLKAVSPQTITALEEVVRKEQDLPATAHYDVQQKKWVDSAKK